MPLVSFFYKKNNNNKSTPFGHSFAYREFFLIHFVFLPIIYVRTVTYFLYLIIFHSVKIFKLKTTIFCLRSLGRCLWRDFFNIIQKFSLQLTSSSLFFFLFLYFRPLQTHYFKIVQSRECFYVKNLKNTNIHLKKFFLV